jgi:choloylglycine hydrolase
MPRARGSTYPLAGPLATVLERLILPRSIAMLSFVRYAAAACAAFGLIVAATSASACTGIRVEAKDGSVVYARTLEFGSDLESQVLFLPRQYEFIGTTASGKPGYTWNSKFAAVGLNAYGLNVLIDGVNEHGLAAGAFYMPGFAEYQEINPEEESQAIAPWELVTWILTNFTSVDEVRAALPGIKVAAAPLADLRGVPPLHFVTHDESGASLVIEYVGGKLYTYDDPIGVITNSPTFDWHITNLRNFINLTATNVPEVDLAGLKLSQLGQGSGLKGLPGDFTPPSRFVRALVLSQDAVQGETGQDSVREAFHILDSFDIPRGVVRPADGEQAAYEYTQWTSASDLKERTYYFHTYDNRRVRSVVLSNFPQDGARPIRIPLHDENAIEVIEPEAIQ